jgi:hypothetical protein
MGIPEATFYRWNQLYGGFKPSEVKKLRRLEKRIRGCVKWSPVSLPADPSRHR